MRRLTMILLLFVLAVAAGLVHAGGAEAGDFADEPCPNAGGDNYLCPSGTQGSPYALDIKLKEPWPNCTEFRVSSGNFPPGLSVSDEGNIRGTPTSSGSFTFYLTVSWKTTGGCVGQPPSDRKFTIPINASIPRMFIATNGLPDANINQAYAPPPLVSAGASASSWQLAGGSLPPGVQLGSNGVIAGTPTASGLFSFTVQANGPNNADTRQLSIFVLAPLELQDLKGKTAPTTGLTATSLVNAPLTTGVKAIGGRGPYAFSSTGALPPGITLDAASGTLSGTGTVAGSYRSNVTVTDQTGAKLTVPFSITIKPLLAFVARRVLPVGRVNRFYAARIPVSGKDASTAIFAVAGRIPPGLELNETTRRLEGTLLVAGRYRLRVYAFSASGAPISKLYTIFVRP